MKSLSDGDRRLKMKSKTIETLIIDVYHCLNEKKKYILISKLIYRGVNSLPMYVKKLWRSPIL